MLLVHGLGEHSGRHQNTVNFMTDHGFEVVRFDLRGAGHSGGRRQWIEHFSDYVEDTAKVSNWISSTLEPLPLFVLGHSLGGAISIHFTAIYGKTMRGLILSAPALIVGEGISPLKIAVGKLLSRVAPHLKIANSTEKNAISRDPQVVEAYQNDPLSCHFNTVRQGNEILKALNAIPDLIKKITLPVLIVHGSMDRIIKLEGSYQILREIASKDRTFHILSGGYHEPHNDLDKEYYFTLMLQWLEKQLSATSRNRVAKPARAQANLGA